MLCFASAVSAIAMDNLLPRVASFDVTSNQFRETALPYQQWEANRTHGAPSTPSDIEHLLPPIDARKTRRNSSNQPIPPRIEPSLPLPAPVDRNLSGLYDPALDPSPIGMEERGIVQPVRITRIVPRRDMGLQEPHRGARAGDESGNTVSTVVTVLNGFRAPMSHRNEGQDEAYNEASVDIFVQGLSKCIEHATLLPSQVFRHALQQEPIHLLRPGTSALAEQPHTPESSSSDSKNCHLGLTVLLTRNGELSECDGFEYTHPTSIIEPYTGAEGDEVAAGASCHGLESQSKTVTRLIFQREDGTPAPSRNAFRVQFEPGPLGVELEEDPGRRGIVQIRRVLQAGQAEQDGRLSAGCLIVAVGDWGESMAANGIDSIAVSELKDDALHEHRPGSASTCPLIVRSLVDLEKAVTSREPGRLFVLWALDRHAPESIAALGMPEPESTRRTPEGMSLQSLHTRLNTADRAVRTSPLANEGLGKAARGLLSAFDRGSRPVIARDAENRAGAAPPEEAPGWEPDTAYGGSLGGKHAVSSGTFGMPYRSRAQGDGGSQRRTHSEADPLPIFSSERNTVGRVPPSLGEAEDQRNWTRDKSVSRTLANQSAISGGGWEFETGGGIFDENDEGLAARRQPPLNEYTAAPVNEVHRRPSSLPLGLHASAVDNLAVFIWFCNNHESAVMKVSWIDYDGKLVLRRSLEPGACYFERSFATHPWVIQHDIKIAQGCSEEEDASEENQWGGKEALHAEKEEGNCCVLRLGDAMAVARLTGSLIWNPEGRTLSVTKQAKVGVPGMSPSALAAVGVAPFEGLGLDPGKKRLCVAGTRREPEAARAMAERASVRREKARILEEMRTWRLHPMGDTGGGSGAAIGGLGQGAPNLRFLMIGSSERDGSGTVAR